MVEIQSMIGDYGGYETVIEKTIKFYIDTAGEWKSKGDDKYSQDAKEIADKLTSK